MASLGQEGLAQSKGVRRCKILLTKKWTKRDTETGHFMDTKQDGAPFKGVRKEQ